MGKSLKRKAANAAHAWYTSPACQRLQVDVRVNQRQYYEEEEDRFLRALFTYADGMFLRDPCAWRPKTKSKDFLRRMEELTTWTFEQYHVPPWFRKLVVCTFLYLGPGPGKQRPSYLQRYGLLPLGPFSFDEYFAWYRCAPFIRRPTEIRFTFGFQTKRCVLVRLEAVRAI